MNKFPICSFALAALVFAACSEDINAPELPAISNVEVPDAQPLDAATLFGEWAATAAYGDKADNHFEQSYAVSFSSVDDGEAVLTHRYIDGGSETRDSTYRYEYTYTFDGSTVSLSPKAAYAAKGASAIKGVSIGNERLMLLTENAARTDTICTLRRTGDPVPSITGVNRTLPEAGETVIITGRNLQFVDHVFLPTTTGEMELTDYQRGSKQISFTLPEADYTSGSIRCQSTTAHVSCYSPAYMFFREGVFFHNFNTFKQKAPYKGTEFEYTIKTLGTVMGKAANLSASSLPDGHSLLLGSAAHTPDSLLSLFGKQPVAWEAVESPKSFTGYLRFSSGDRFQYVLDHCSGALTSRTRCADAAIQMDIYVWSDGKPEWNTGYLSWRLNKDQSSLTSTMLANVAEWEAGAPASFADGWHTFTIPLTAFPVASGSTSTLGSLISLLKSSNLQTILTLVNYPLDSLHPAQSLSEFQFSIANIRLVPYATPDNTQE